MRWLRFVELRQRQRAKLRSALELVHSQDSRSALRASWAAWRGAVARARQRTVRAQALAAGRAARLLQVRGSAHAAAAFAACIGCPPACPTVRAPAQLDV